MHVFVYGTLTDPERVGRVLDSYVFVGSAVLHGLHAVDGEYPTLAPGGEVGGRVLRTDEIDALDEYERVEDGLYTRVAVPTKPGEVTPDSDDRGGTAVSDSSDSDTEKVAVYVGDPERLDADAEWPGDGPFSERVQAFLTGSDVWLDLSV
jgi:gamma-glutamylcyclotransferase (GGCT)/AIG2-like uncharacterized protein YtfP